MRTLFYFGQIAAIIIVWATIRYPHATTIDILILALGTGLVLYDYFDTPSRSTTQAI